MSPAPCDILRQAKQNWNHRDHRGHRGHRGTHREEMRSTQFQTQTVALVGPCLSVLSVDIKFLSSSRLSSRPSRLRGLSLSPRIFAGCEETDGLCHRDHRGKHREPRSEQISNGLAFLSSPLCALGGLCGSTSSRLSSRPSRLRGCIWVAGGSPAMGSLWFNLFAPAFAVCGASAAYPVTFRGLSYA